MADIHPYSRPPVGMNLIGQGPEQQQQIAVWLVKIALPELFDDNTLLVGKPLLCQVEAPHPV
ncbi:MAG: hypothetical protein BWY89_01266 [Bacteroidetes bacterium ADurb.BinA012]|nr:MAG: hypothetical protein BWY89_01266 [Bacteroidetes bacterium ADurb.BinA012]